MRRQLFSVISAMSLALCAATSALWVRSFAVAEVFHWARTAEGNGADESKIGKLGLAEVAISRGRIQLLIEMNTAYLDQDWIGYQHYPIALSDFQVPPRLTNPIGMLSGQPQVFKVYFNLFGLGVYRDDVNPNSRDYLAIFPFWIIVVISGILPARWLTKLARRQTRRTGFSCSSCGYDLRATPERCPECGMARPRVAT